MSPLCIELMSRIGLGTVQFGLDYGISNNRGKVSHSAVSGILSTAWEAGIRTVDTASLYGESEAVLGVTMAPSQPFRVVTKTPVITGSQVTNEDIESFRAALIESLRLLGLPSVYGLLLHHGNNLLLSGGQSLIRLLKDLKSEGMVARIGVSVYSCDEIDAILQTFVPDIVQIPFNVADRRLAQSGHLRKLKDLGVEIHARSLFLQGVLLQDPETLPDFFAPVKPDLMQFGDAARTHGLTRIEACLASAFAQPELDSLLLGVTHISELQQIISAVHHIASQDVAFSPDMTMPVPYIDPSQWP